MQRYFDIGGGNEDRVLHIEQERSNLRDTLTQNDTARLTSQLALNRANCSCDSRRLRDCLLIPSLSHPRIPPSLIYLRKTQTIPHLLFKQPMDLFQAGVPSFFILSNEVCAEE